MDSDATYLPGYGEQTTRMLTARTSERAAFVPTDRLTGARVVDLGCGPGTLTVALGHRIGSGGHLLAVDVAPHARSAATTALRRDLGGLSGDAPRWAVLGGAAGAIPVADASVDLVFAHALFEHLAEPAAALADIRRVLRPHGTAAVVSSDWSGALVEPQDPRDDAAVRAALDGYRHTRRQAGADPDAGAHLTTWVARAGFTVVHHAARWREDIVGAELARYIGERLAPGLTSARAGAARWARQPEPARVRQRWVEVLGVLDG